MELRVMVHEGEEEGSRPVGRVCPCPGKSRDARDVPASRPGVAAAAPDGLPSVARPSFNPRTER
jgi:hypothetical protein